MKYFPAPATTHEEAGHPRIHTILTSHVKRAMITVAVALMALVLVPVSASGHASSAESSPAADAVLDVAPDEVRVEFDSGLLEMGSALIVRDATGRSITSGTAVVGDRTISVPVDPAAGPGLYEVAYRVVSADGHTVEESFSYTVSDGTASTTAPATTAESSGPSGLPLGWLVAGGVIVILGVGAALLWRR